MKLRCVTILLAAFLAATESRAAEDVALVQAVYGPQRTAKLEARDTTRHPIEELEFFGIKPTMTVVEIWPAGGYWTEILAPYLYSHGTYYAASFPPNSGDLDKAATKYQQKLTDAPDIYGHVKVVAFGKDNYNLAPDGSVDLIVTFRNLHNWLAGDYAKESFASFFRALKPGGVLGIEDHRSRPNKPQDPKAASGYVRQDYAIQLAKEAGFNFVASSEINANPKDTTDWPKGVWTLPPTFSLGDVDRAKYEAIGEADNFVLKFRKPLKMSASSGR